MLTRRSWLGLLALGLLSQLSSGCLCYRPLFPRLNHALTGNFGSGPLLGAPIAAPGIAGPTLDAGYPISGGVPVMGGGQPGCCGGGGPISMSPGMPHEGMPIGQGLSMGAHPPMQMVSGGGSGPYSGFPTTFNGPPIQLGTPSVSQPLPNPKLMPAAKQ